jgi:hypothetical protein
MREVLSMTENSAAAAQEGKVICPCAVLFRFMRLIAVLYQVGGGDEKVVSDVGA